MKHGIIALIALIVQIVELECSFLSREVHHQQEQSGLRLIVSKR